MNAISVFLPIALPLTKTQFPPFNSARSKQFGRLLAPLFTLSLTKRHRALKADLAAVGLVKLSFSHAPTKGKHANEARRRSVKHEVEMPTCYATPPLASTFQEKSTRSIQETFHQILGMTVRVPCKITILTSIWRDTYLFKHKCAATLQPSNLQGKLQ